MPLLVQQSLGSAEPKAINFVALDGSTDSFPFNNDRAFLILQNTSGSTVTVVLLGNTATTVPCPGITTVDVSAGKSVPIAANSSVVVDLTNARAYLSDSDNRPDITGGTANINAALVTA